MSDLLTRQVPFRAAEAREAGVSARELRSWAEAGRVLTLGRGLYLPSGAGVDPDLAEITARAPRATLCLTTALAHHGLVDTIPSAYDLAQPRDSYRPRTVAAVAWHEFDAGTFDIGRGTETIRGVVVPIYSPERSIVDAFRLRGYEGYETGTRALKAWLMGTGNDPAALISLARRLPRAYEPLARTLEALL